MRLCIASIAFLAFFSAKAQQGIFNFEVLHTSKDIYEMSFQFNEAVAVQFIRVDLYDDNEFLMGSHEAIINKKSDGQYYLFFEGKEELIHLDQFQLVINNPYGKINMRKQYIEVQLLDRQMKPIDTYRKEIF